MAGQVSNAFRGVELGQAGFCRVVCSPHSRNSGYYDMETLVESWLETAEKEWKFDRWRLALTADVFEPRPAIFYRS